MLRYNEQKVMNRVDEILVDDTRKMMRKLNKAMRKLDASKISKEEKENEMSFVESALTDIRKTVRRNLEI